MSINRLVSIVSLEKNALKHFLLNTRGRLKNKASLFISLIPVGDYGLARAASSLVIHAPAGRTFDIYNMSIVDVTIGVHNCKMVFFYLPH